jgi:hypothetical protein
MAVIYMVHPRHGAKVAISEEEAAADEMYGWERMEDPLVSAEKPAPRRRRTQADQED